MLTKRQLRQSAQYKEMVTGIRYNGKPKSKLNKGDLILLIEREFGNVFPVHPNFPANCNEYDDVGITIHHLRNSVPYWYIFDDVKSLSSGKKKGEIEDVKELCEFINETETNSLYKNYPAINDLMGYDDGEIDNVGKTLKFLSDKGGLVYKVFSASEKAIALYVSVPEVSNKTLVMKLENNVVDRTKANYEIAMSYKMSKMNLGPVVYYGNHIGQSLILVMETLDPLDFILTKKLDDSDLKKIFEKLKTLLHRLALMRVVHGDFHVGNIGTRDDDMLAFDFDLTSIQASLSEADVMKGNITQLIASLNLSREVNMKPEDKLHEYNIRKMLKYFKKIWKDMKFSADQFGVDQMETLLDNSRYNNSILELPTSTIMKAKCKQYYPQLDSWFPKPVYKYAVLMLAHDGIINTDIWSRWLTYMNSEPDSNFSVKLYVVTQDNVKHESDFLRKHDTEVRVDTKRCTLSLVEAYSKGVKSLPKDIDYVFFTSGADIPLVNRDTLQNRFSRLSCYASTDLDPKGTSKFVASQWIHLTISDALYLAYNYRRAPIQMKSGIGGEELCPDEYVPRFVLEKLGNRYLKDDQLTYLEYKSSEEESPVTWNTWDGKRKIQKHGSKSPVTTTLRQIVMENRDVDNGGYFFFRKVGQKLPHTESLHDTPWL